MRKTDPGHISGSRVPGALSTGSGKGLRPPFQLSLVSFQDSLF